MQHNQKGGVIMSSSDLALQGITKTQMGNYSCVASNVEGDGESSIVNPIQRSTFSYFPRLVRHFKMYRLVLFLSCLISIKIICAMIIKTELRANQTTNFQNFCMCMPYWQCKEDYSGLTNDLASIVDIRMANAPQNPCLEDFDVCCRVECGRRRRSNYMDDKFGLGLKMRSSFGTRFSNFLGKRILGQNNEAEQAEFPWMLGILWNKTFQCGASLIHPQVALTAAHCVYGKRGGSFKVRAGEWNWETDDEEFPFQDRFTSRIIIHQQYHPISVRNDIALLVLNKPFELTTNVGVACVPPRTMKYDGSICTASGWGKNIHHDGIYQSILKKTDLPLVSRDKCIRILQQNRLGPLFRLHRSFICAGGEEEKDTCKGDGGSPLVCQIEDEEDRYEQIGIVSWGLTCGSKNTPGVYVNVPLFSDWIDGQMERLNFDTNIYRY